MNLIAAATQAMQSGQFGLAEQMCRQALTADGQNANTHNLLGAICGQTGRHGEAVQHFATAVRLAPAALTIRKNHATALLTLQRYDEAAQAISEALALAPQDVSLIQQQALLLAQQGQLPAAIRVVEQALANHPQHPALWFYLAEFARRSHDSAAALAHLRRTTSLAPNWPDPWHNLAGVHLERHEYIEAMQAIQQVLKLEPRSLQAYCNLATVLNAAGDVDQGVVAARNALQINPQHLRPKVQLAGMLIALGEIEEAQQIVSELLQHDPTNVNYRIIQARILEHRGDLEGAEKALPPADESQSLDPEVALTRSIILEQLGRLPEAIQTLTDVLDKNPYIAEHGVGIQFQLGQCYDVLERYDEAFAMYRQGNDHRREVLFTIDSGRTRGQFNDALIAAYSPELYARCPSARPRSSQDIIPIFIVGMPRSGTSLTEQILARHPDVHAAGELPFVRDCLAATFATSQPTHGPLEIVDVDPSGEVSCLVPKFWETINQQQIDELAADYLRRAQKLQPKTRYITDKMPFNYTLLPIMRRMFPESPIIHIRRHPLDTCLSCYFQNFTSGHQYSYDLETLGDFYREYVRIVNYFRDTLQIPFLEIDYEDLVTRSTEQVSSLLSYCGLSPHEACLKPHESRRVVRTASYQQVRKPIYTSSVGRWKHYRQHLQPLIDQLGPELARLGD